jgi:putative ABC transport system permease protein
VPFEIVGVLIAKGMSVDGAAEEDNQVIVPINTALRRLFNVDYQRVVIETEVATVASFRVMIAGMGAVALVVGGVGILSIMLLSVRERRSEIGLRVAVGARRRDVWLQFLIEAVVLAGAGRALGLVLGLALSWVVSAITEWTAVVTLSSVATAVAAALTIGLVFGVYPALRAASWNPIDALRAS